MDFKNPNETNINGLHDLIESSYKRNRQAEDAGFKHGVQLDHNLSNSEHKVFVDPNTNNSTVVFTGSRKASDWLITNPMIALGLQKYTPRFKNSEKLVKKVKDKYNGTITAIGHSLGGRLAESAKADKKITINKAVGLGDIGKKINKNQTDIRTNKDIVSGLATTQKYKNNLVTIKTKGANLLDAHSYKHLKKI